MKRPMKRHHTSHKKGAGLSLAGEMRHTASLPYGYTCTWVYSQGGITAEWSPDIPRFDSARARRKFTEAYQAARVAFDQMLANALGGNVLTIDAAPGMETIHGATLTEPSTKH